MMCMLCVLISIPNRGDFNEYAQHMIILQRIKKASLNYSHLPPELALWLTLSGSKYPVSLRNHAYSNI